MFLSLNQFFVFIRHAIYGKSNYRASIYQLLIRQPYVYKFFLLLVFRLLGGLKVIRSSEINQNDNVYNHYVSFEQCRKLSSLHGSSMQFNLPDVAIWKVNTHC